jgi:hypothetical protein
LIAVARGGGSGPGGIGISPAEALAEMAKTSNRPNTKFLTGLIDLLLKNVVVKPVKWCATK